MMNKNKKKILSKEQEKRFEKWYLEVTDTRKWRDGKPVVGGYLYVTFGNAVKQFIADELAKQKEEIIKKLREIKKEDWENNVYKNMALDQAIKLIKEL